MFALKVSVIIPCFQEEESLPGLAGALEAWAGLTDLELILVDDGSTDRTGEVARELFPRARHLKHLENRGLGAALRTGTMAATGELIAWFDADCTYDPALLPEMVAAWKESGAAAVTASPWHPRGRAVGVGFLRALPSRVVSRIYRLLAPGRLWTYTAMVRLHNRDTILRALPEHPGFPGVTESILRILELGVQVIEVPATLRVRQTGASKLRFCRVVAGHLGLMGALLRGKLKP